MSYHIVWPRSVLEMCTEGQELFAGREIASCGDDFVLGTMRDWPLSSSLSKVVLGCGSAEPNAVSHSLSHCIRRFCTVLWFPSTSLPRDCILRPADGSCLHPFKGR